MVVYKNDSSVAIILSVGVDISDATVMRIKYRRPDGYASYWTAEASGTTAITYTTDADDLCIAGDWRLQAYVENTWKRHGLICRLRVEDTL